MSLETRLHEKILFTYCVHAEITQETSTGDRGYRFTTNTEVVASATVRDPKQTHHNKDLLLEQRKFIEH